jgi:hypothetical protein
VANNLNLYDPIFYSQNALIQLEKSLGMAARIHRGYDKSPQQKGSTIQISRPGTFTAADEPSTAQDLNPENVSIQLSYWRGVKFALTDKELTYTTEQIIADHIRPATVAIADDIDQKLALLVNDVPWYDDAAATPTSADIVNLNTGLFGQNVPMDDQMLHLMIDGSTYGSFLKDAVFNQNQGAGEAGIATQMRGTLGRKFGFEIFRNQNVQSHVKGTASTGTLAVNGLTALGATTINLDAGAVTGTLVPGDTFVIAGNTQRYAITNTVTAATNAFAGVTFTPALRAAAADNAVVTVSLDDHVMNVGFHRNAFALAMAPLSEVGNGLGARMDSVSDPITGLSLRSRIWYEGGTSKVYVGIDVLYGIKTLDPNLARRLRG